MDFFCSICGRPLTGVIDKHHLIPIEINKTNKNRKNTIAIHRICHEAIHYKIKNTDLAATYNSPKKIRSHSSMSRFISYIEKLPTSYYASQRVISKKIDSKRAKWGEDWDYFGW